MPLNRTHDHERGEDTLKTKTVHTQQPHGKLLFIGGSSFLSVMLPSIFIAQMQLRLILLFEDAVRTKSKATNTRSHRPLGRFLQPREQAQRQPGAKPTPKATYPNMGACTPESQELFRPHSAGSSPYPVSPGFPSSILSLGSCPSSPLPVLGQKPLPH